MITRGMTHQASFPAGVTEGRRLPPEIKKEYTTYLKNLSIMGQALNTYIGLSPKETKEYNKGEDVWFDYRRMMELLENSRNNIWSLDIKTFL